MKIIWHSKAEEDLRISISYIANDCFYDLIEIDLLRR